jgi:hypothetical protein
MKKTISSNLFTNVLHDSGFRTVHFFDRIKIHFDSATRWHNIKKIVAKNPDNIIEQGSLPHHETINSWIDLYQPSCSYLKEIEASLSGDYVINFVEFAFDIICDTQSGHKKMQKLIEQILVQQRCGNNFYHCRKGPVYYYGIRPEHEDIIVVYSDRESKMDVNKRCVHIELRMSGSKILKNFDIYTLDDLITFEHAKVWDEYLDLRSVNYKKLGQLICSDKLDLADSSYWRRGIDEFNKYGSAQALLNAYPEYAAAFDTIQNRRMFGSRLNKA